MGGGYYEDIRSVNENLRSFQAAARRLESQQREHAFERLAFPAVVKPV